MGRFPVSVFFFFLLLAGFFIFPLRAQDNFDWVLSGDKIEETEGRGLMIRSNPSGARVYIDGIERGTTPLRLSELRAGAYFVRLEKEGYIERRFRITVRPGSVMDVSLELKEAVGRVMLRLRPALGAPGQDLLPLDPRISVDGRSFSGPAPVLASAMPLELSAGFRTILVRAFGWEDVSITEYIEEDVLRELELEMKPAPFRLSGGSVNRPRFNPANAGSLGSATFSFEVSAPGKGIFTVEDNEGKTVFARGLGPFETWSQTAVWDGRDNNGKILGDGIYTLIVKVNSLPRDDSVPVEYALVSELALDSTRLIYPLTLSSGKSGLLYAPLPDLLPPRSFQIEGSLMACSPPVSGPASSAAGSGEAWKSLPFAVAFRFSPIEQLEVSAALNVIPYFEEKPGAGIGAGAKWVFLSSRKMGLPLGAAAGFIFSWTWRTGVTPFGMASGFEFFFPFKVDLGRLFSFTVSPAVLWTGDEGFPWEPAPRLLVSGGLLMQMTYVSAGLSLRSEFKFSDGKSWPPCLTMGTEVKISPPPSSFVISLMGGIWIRDHDVGGFGGLGIGMIY